MGRSEGLGFSATVGALASLFLLSLMGALGTGLAAEKVSAETVYIRRGSEVVVVDGYEPIRTVAHCDLPVE